MDYEITSDLNEIDKQQWNKFVFDHSQGNIFQSPFMYDVFKATKNYQPIVLICYEKKNKAILGVLSAILQREKGLSAIFSSRAVIWGGPLVYDNLETQERTRILEVMLNEYSRIIPRKTIYTQIRNLFDISAFHESLAKFGYKYEEHLNILIDLKKTETELWKDIHETRRRQIKRAQKNNLRIIKISKKTQLIESYKILREVYSKAKLPFADISMFLAAFVVLFESGMVRFYGAYYDNELLGIMFMLCYKDRAIEWYGGSLKKHYGRYPNSYLPWYIMNDLKTEGYKTFDWGGAGKPSQAYSVRDYKEKFGGQFVNFGRYQKIHRPILMVIGTSGIKLWKIRKR
jgi:serine/alanine adding enzyme